MCVYIDIDRNVIISFAVWIYKYYISVDLLVNNRLAMKYVLSGNGLFKKLILKHLKFKGIEYLSQTQILSFLYLCSLMSDGVNL